MPAKLDRCVEKFMKNPANIKKWPNAKVRRSHAFAICTAAIKKSSMTEQMADIYLGSNMSDDEEPPKEAKKGKEKEGER